MTNSVESGGTLARYRIVLESCVLALSTGTGASGGVCEGG